jgi:hypothetical protein
MKQVGGKALSPQIPQEHRAQFGATNPPEAVEIARRNEPKTSTGLLSRLLPRAPQDKLNHDLRTAVKLRDVTKIARLMSNGADPNARSRNGNTAISHANNGGDHATIAAVTPRSRPDEGQTKQPPSLREMIAARWGNRVMFGQPHPSCTQPAIWASTRAPGKFGLHIPGWSPVLVDSWEDAQRSLDSFFATSVVRQTASPPLVMPARPQQWQQPPGALPRAEPQARINAPQTAWPMPVMPLQAQPRPTVPLGAPPQPRTEVQQPQQMQWGRPAPQLQIASWQSPLHEAVARLGGNVLFRDVHPIDAMYRGEEFGAYFGTRVKYLNSDERKAFKLTVRNGLLYDAQDRLFDTRNATTAWGESGKAIYVMDHSGNLYASNQQVSGKFHHSSFLSGAPAAAAGELVVVRGVIQHMNRRTGHYKASKEQLQQCANHLVSAGVKPSFTVDWGNFQ